VATKVVVICPIVTSMF